MCVAWVNCAGVSTPCTVCASVMRACRRSAYKGSQLLLGGPHFLPERLHRRAIGAVRLSHLCFLVIAQLKGM